MSDLERSTGNITVTDLDTNTVEVFLSPAEERAQREAEKQAEKNSSSLFWMIQGIFLIVVLAIVIIVAYRIKHFGTFISQADVDAIPSNVKEETMDLINPLVDKDGYLIRKDWNNILVFGNDPFAADRDSTDGLANKLAQATGATVYNAAISGSYLSSASDVFDENTNPMDAYSFYWLCHVATTRIVTPYLDRAASVLGDDTPAEAEEVKEMLESINVADMDAIIIMYDAADYLADRNHINHDFHTDITTCHGNLEAGIELLQQYCPNTRIIVMSPTFAYARDKKGNKVSSIIQANSYDNLSLYCVAELMVCEEMSITYVDHFFGTVNEDNADDYLIDDKNLNAAGREAVLERTLYALNYYASASEAGATGSDAADKDTKNT